MTSISSASRTTRCWPARKRRTNRSTRRASPPWAFFCLRWALAWFLAWFLALAFAWSFMGSYLQRGSRPERAVLQGSWRWLLPRSSPPPYVARRGQQPVDTVAHHLGHAVDAGAHHRQPTGHRLQQHVGDAVAVAVGGDERGEGEHVGAP